MNELHYHYGAAWTEWAPIIKLNHNKNKLEGPWVRPTHCYVKTKQMKLQKKVNRWVKKERNKEERVSGGRSRSNETETERTTSRAEAETKSHKQKSYVKVSYRQNRKQDYGVCDCKINNTIDIIEHKTNWPQPVVALFLFCFVVFCCCIFSRKISSTSLKLTHFTIIYQQRYEAPSNASKSKH